jgi:hypothetical protein
MKRLYAILVSQTTAVALFAATMAVSIAGSLTLPRNLALFSGIDDTPLFAWLGETARLDVTWWIYLMVAMMGLLALSTALCTAEALLRLRGAHSLALRLSPQFMHLGVLLVLLGHFLTAAIGAREDVLMGKDAPVDLGGGVTATVTDVRQEEDEYGYARNWEADVTIEAGGISLGTATLRPARPASIGPFSLFIRSVETGESPSALVRVVRDPGATWALAGGVVVTLSCIWYAYGRMRSPA